MAAKNPDKSTTSAQEMGFTKAVGLCFKLPVVTAAKTAATTLVLVDSAASALADNEVRLKKTVKHIINEGITTANMAVVGIAKLNCELGESLGINPKDDLDSQITAVYSRYEKKEEIK